MREQLNICTLILLLTFIVYGNAVGVIGGFDYQVQNIQLVSSGLSDKQAKQQKSNNVSNDSVTVDDLIQITNATSQAVLNPQNQTESQKQPQNSVTVINAATSLPNKNNQNQLSDYPYLPQIQPIRPFSKLPLKLLNDAQEDRQKQISGIIITIYSGSSYDRLFEEVTQKSKQGTRVLVYQAVSSYLGQIVNELEVARLNSYVTLNTVLGLMVQRILTLAQSCPSCIIFNWECSSGYSSRQFAQGKAKVFKLVGIIIQRGYMAMFSDFSLKALIKQWDQAILGPNPFIEISSTSSRVQLTFNNQTLANAPSAQLQAVSSLAEDGKVLVNVLGGTIVYDVNLNRKDTDLYELQVLTLAQQYISNNRDTSRISSYGEVVGHTLLTYKSGGYILTSMVHWIQLMKINTSADRLFEVAESQFGAQYSAALKQEYNTLDIVQQQAYVQTNARSIVQNQSPGQNAAYKK